MMFQGMSSSTVNTGSKNILNLMLNQMQRMKKKKMEEARLFLKFLAWRLNWMLLPLTELRNSENKLEEIEVGITDESLSDHISLSYL